MIQPLTTLKAFLISAFFVLFLLQNTFAAGKEELVPRVSYWEFGFSGGLSKFLTSSNPNADAVYTKFNYWDSKLNVGISLSAIRHISPVFSFEFNYLKSGVSGSWDANKGYPVPPKVIEEGLSVPPPFKTGINQFSLSLNTNLNKLFFPKQADDNWYIYLKGGAGYSLLKCTLSIRLGTDKKVLRNAASKYCCIPSILGSLYGVLTISEIVISVELMI